MQKLKKPMSIKQLLIAFMIFIMVVQVLLFIIIITIGGGLKTISNNSLQPFVETSQLRVEALETNLNQAASVLESNSTVIKNNLQSVANAYNTPISLLLNNENAKAEMYRKNINLLRSLSAREGVTGAFLIMDTNVDINTPVSAVVVRKTDKATENANAPTTLLVGGDYLLQDGATHKSIYWSQTIDMALLDNYDFYIKPLEIAENNPNVATENLGYWSNPYDLNGTNDVVAYSLPIRDAQNQIVGVMGIEMDLNYIQLLLPYYELNSQGNGSYIIASMQSEAATEGTRILTSGSTFNEINNHSTSVEYGEPDDFEGVYDLVAKGKILSKVYATKNTVNIYEHAEYKYSPWVLSGVVEGQYLFASLNKLRINMLIAMLITMVICTIFIFKFASEMVRPINYFVAAIKKIRPDNLEMPKPTKITEINELGTSIADLTAELSSFSTKASAIISMTGISIAAFEYDPTSNLVFCTDEMFKILGIHRNDNELYIERAIFDNRITSLIQKIRPDIDTTASVRNGKEMKWLHIKTVQNGNKILGTIRDVTADMLEKKKLDFERDHDLLTSLLKRQPFIDMLRERFDKKPPQQALFAVCKIKDLLSLNSRYGSIIGDKYIKSLSKSFAVLDEKTTSIARTSGDEFTVMIEGPTNEAITEKFNKLLEKLNEAIFEEDGVEIPHNIFAGVAWYPNDTNNLEELITYAEYAAQASDEVTGRNLVQSFSLEAYQQAVEKHNNNDRIGNMLENCLIGYAYQPIIDATTGDIYGYEALMRPDNSLGVSPSDVIEYAVNNDALYAVEKMTWLNSLKDFTKQVDCLSPKKLFVNSIPNQLLNEEDIAALEENYNDYLDNIVLEILENEQTDSDCIKKRHELKDKWKCMLALDDFGSGYANENALLAIKPDLIKLDLDLVANIQNDDDRQSLVKNIVGYAHNRNIKVLAEGIESREQMNILLSLQVDLLQGFYLAKPTEDIITKIDEKVKSEILTFDPDDMFYANVALRM